MRVHGWYVVSLAGVIALGLCLPTVVGVGGSQVVISWCAWLTSVGKSKKHVRGNSHNPPHPPLT